MQNESSTPRKPEFISLEWDFGTFPLNNTAPDDFDAARLWSHFDNVPVQLFFCVGIL